jgi:hypothetical protein
LRRGGIIGISRPMTVGPVPYFLIHPGVPE